MTGPPFPAWPLPPADIALEAGEVHVWRASLQAPEPRIAEFHATLSSDERERASRYRLLHDRQRFIAARGWLRAILSTYLHVDAGQVRFHYNPHGKPELDEAQEEVALQFNLAHSQDLALYAVCWGHRVGIDIERIRPGVADDGVSENVFAAREIAALHSLPPQSRERAFFACWTRKEAYIKARGQGLVMPLDAFEVSLLPGDPPALLRTPADPEEAARWSLYELDLGPDYAATLAVEGQGWHLRLWQHPGLVQG